MTDNSTKRETKNFIEQAIDSDLASGRFKTVNTRFPPEPNGYLHIGHAKSICLNFGLAKKHDGTCNLRFDDTNPVKEDTEYVEAIKNDIRWLGFEWDSLHFASDYFDQLYDWAELLIQNGDAYVCDLSADEMRKYRGSLTETGQNSPFRNRTIDENLDLFRRMRSGEFADGAKSLRAKIDMASPNMNMRDPVMYRILRAHHHRTGDKWCIYPTYDWTHGQSDSLENISFSICTLEFENHRPLYDWFCQKLGIHHPRQIEFAKLKLSSLLVGKRFMLQLVKEGHVNGWDDPRMPTLSGYRRRGYTPESIRNFCTDVGVAKFNSTIDIIRLENAVREHLNKVAPRKMVVLNPVKLTITNWPEGQVETNDAVNNPENPEAGCRKVPFSANLLIDREDFKEDAPRKFFRLKKGGSVRLRAGYIIDCHDVIKDESGEIQEILCTYDPETRSGSDHSGRKVKGTIHWVSADHAEEIEVRLYDRLFVSDDPGSKNNKNSFIDDLNPDSLTITRGYAEPEIKKHAIGEQVQFERVGYFVVDPDSTPEKMVMNRIVPLRDTWGKIEAQAKTS
ncbi:glutamine--tRNA ligase/YqeY domain fusion protein [Rubripirellula sp.]|jgi:glutaminyl-tRNA synthetase|nr:glutamine--tRNA ligase/YqeY domain fusion protein [Rubripirellula sp.]